MGVFTEFQGWIPGPAFTPERPGCLLTSRTFKTSRALAPNTPTSFQTPASIITNMRMTGLGFDKISSSTNTFWSNLNSYTDLKFKIIIVIEFEFFNYLLNFQINL